MVHTMRRKDREVTDKKQLLDILDMCKVCRIAMQDEQGLYIIPLNFGYKYENETLHLFFHSAKEGRKVNAFEKNPEVTFEMDCGHQLIEGKTACEYGYEFQSIVGTGNIHIVKDKQEQKKGLSLLMKHMTGKEFTFEDNMLNAVFVYRLEVHEFTGKRKKAM